MSENRLKALDKSQNIRYSVNVTTKYTSKESEGQTMHPHNFSILTPFACKAWSQRFYAETRAF